MLKFLELNAVDLRVEKAASATRDGPYFEEDDLERPLGQEGAAAIPAADVPTFPITVMAHAIRDFYPRKGGRPGTRIVYPNGAAEIVIESYEQVKAALKALNG